MPFATDEQKAALLIKHLYDPILRDSALAQMRRMFPDWEFVWRDDFGLCIYLPFGEHNVPRALAYAAGLIQQHVEGGSVILKDRPGPHTDARDLRAIPALPKTCYERLLEDDEF